MRKKIISLLLALAVVLSFAGTSFAVEMNTLDTAIEDVAEYVYKAVQNPQVGSIGGEWAVIGLARSGHRVPDSYYENYYRTVEEYIKATDGILHEKKYTEYSRVILGLTAAGYDPRNVAGYDLTLPLGDFEKTIWQGINGPIFALIALDSADYPIPQNSEAKTQATRDLYIAEILRCQLLDGGFNLTAGSGGEPIESREKADPDITGMALQALAKYQDMPEIKTATDRALTCLSNMQDTSGGYASWGKTNVESTSQVLVALCELGIALDDMRFVKNGNTLIDNIFSFKSVGGSYKHTADEGGNSQMSTEQVFYALVAAKRAAESKNSLYRMGDAKKRVETIPQKPTKSGLPGKNSNVNVMPVISPGKTFGDVKDHANQKAIEKLSERAIINGKTDTSFDPDATMTRAEYAAIITRGLALEPKEVNIFEDVESGAWYAGYVGTAYAYGIVAGTSPAIFNPNGTITRQEAAVMTARAAKLCGMNTTLDDLTVRDTLAQFGDYITVSDWARESLAFCYQSKILSDEEFNIQPALAARRFEIAQMLYNMLERAKLL